MRASEFLQEAANLMAERAQEYDRENQGGERSIPATVAAFNAITGHELSEAEGWLFMQILKDVRQWSCKTYHKDSAEDGVAYAALKAEALVKEKPHLD